MLAVTNLDASVFKTAFFSMFYTNQVIFGYRLLQQPTGVGRFLRLPDEELMSVKSMWKDALNGSFLT